MKERTFLVIGLLAYLPLNASAQNTHPIDTVQLNCLDKNHTTLGMVQCTSEALKSWDQELNRVYKQLMAKLTPQAKQQLKKSQRQWIRYRDAEIEYLNTMFQSEPFNGTLYRVVAADARMNLTKSRVAFLNDYLELHSH